MPVSFSQENFIHDFVRAFKSEVRPGMSEEAASTLAAFAAFVARELDADPVVGWDSSLGAIMLSSGRRMSIPRSGAWAYPAGMLPPSPPSVHVFNAEQGFRSSRAPHAVPVDYQTRR